LCCAEDAGVIAEPVPAREELPDWFRQLRGIDRNELSATNNGLTVKRCSPFLDALSAGWIIPLAATVRLEVSDDGKRVDAGWEFDRPMVSNHSPFQVAGNPHEPRPPMKFHNYWTVSTAPGWSSLFIPALNRPNGIFEVFSGVVDTDRFPTPVNFPFVVTAPDGVHVLPKGTPLVQVISVRRADMESGGCVRPESDLERERRALAHRNVIAGGSWYRTKARARR
jgi:hypothetical protein